MGWDAPWHWVILAIIVIALFGYKKMPDAARSVGRSLRIFKTEIKGMSDDDRAREDKAREDKARAEAADSAAPANPPAIAPASEEVAATPPPAPAPVTTPAQPNGTAAPQQPHTD